MSTLFGGAHGRASQPTIPIPEAALRMTTSVQGKPRPIGWGRNRVGTNVIWIGDFTPYLVANYTPPTVTQAGGKGGGSRTQQQGTITYTWNYYIRASFSICEGPITAVVAVNTGNSWTSWAGAPNLAGETGSNQFGAGNFAGPLLNATLYPGSETQNPPGEMLSLHPAQALAYRGEAYLYISPFVLGTSTSIPQMSLDVIFGHLCGLINFPFEAYAGDVILDYLTNPEYGVPGYTTDLVETPTLFNTFCGANSLLVSPVITDQVEASSFINDLLQATHAAIFMSGGKLRIRPYAEADASDNDVTFTHDATPIYDLEPQDFLPGANGTDPIEISRKQPQEITNNLRIEYLDRDNSYAPTILETRDEASIIAYGIERSSDVRGQHFFCRKECASVSAALQLQREQVTTNYTFNLPREFELLDPMDLVTLPLDKYGRGQARQPALIIEIVENDDYSFTITAEEYLGTANMPVYSRQDTTHNLPDFNKTASSVNQPVIFELPMLLSGGLKVYTALSGQDPDNWGGAEIWASFDGDHYIMIDRVFGSSRMGLTTSSLAGAEAETGAATGTIYTELATLSIMAAVAALPSGAGGPRTFSDSISLAATASINTGTTRSSNPIATVSASLTETPLGRTLMNHTSSLAVAVAMRASGGATSYTDLISFAAHPAIVAGMTTGLPPVTWNASDKSTNSSLSGGGLVATNIGASGTDACVRATLGKTTSGYFEVTFATTSGGDFGAEIGFSNTSESIEGYIGQTTNGAAYVATGLTLWGDSTPNTGLAAWGSGDVLGAELMSDGTFKFYKNGTLIVHTTFGRVGTVYPAIDISPGYSATANFGATPFLYLPAGAVFWDENASGIGSSTYNATASLSVSPVETATAIRAFAPSVTLSIRPAIIASVGGAGGGTSYSVSASLALAPVIAAAGANAVTWNQFDKDPNVSLAGGRLIAENTGPAGSDALVRATVSKTAGYFEVTFGTTGGGPFGAEVGFSNTSESGYIGLTTNGVGYTSVGRVVWGSSSPYTGLATFGSGDTVGVELLSDGTIKFYKNGTLIVHTTMGVPGPAFPSLDIGYGYSGTANFGATTMLYLPTGANSWAGAP